MSTSDHLIKGLRPYRTRNFLTQEELAELLGVSGRSVQDYEATPPRATPRPSVLRRISELYEAERKRVEAA